MPELRVPSLLKLSANRLGELTAGADGPRWVARIVADPVACDIAKTESDCMEARHRIRLAAPNEESLAGALVDFGAALREPAASAVRQKLAHNALQVARVYTPLLSNLFDVRQALTRSRLNVALEPRAASLVAGVVGTLALHGRVVNALHADAVMHGKLAWRRSDNSLCAADLGVLLRLFKGSVLPYVPGYRNWGGLSAPVKGCEEVASRSVAAQAHNLPSALSELEALALAEASRASRESWTVPATRITCQIAAQPRAEAAASLQRLQDTRPAAHADAMTAMLAPAWAIVGGAEGHAALSLMAQGTVKERLAAAKALRDLREPSPHALLLRLARDGDLSVFERAVASLLHCGAQEEAFWQCIHAAATSPDVPKRLSVARMCADAAATLPDHWWHRSASAVDVRQRIAERLKNLKMPEFFSLLRRLATDPEHQVADLALFALITIPSEAHFALEVAEPLRLHPDASRRFAAATVYMAGGQKAALQKLLSLVGPQNPDVDYIAAVTLARLGGPEAAAKLALLATSKCDVVRYYALRGLSELGGDAAAVALEREVRAPVAKQVLLSLFPGHSWPPTPLLGVGDYLDSEHRATDGLMAVGGPGAVTWLLEEIAAGRDLLRNIDRAEAFQHLALSEAVQKLACHRNPAVRAKVGVRREPYWQEPDEELEVLV